MKKYLLRLAVIIVLLLVYFLLDPWFETINRRGEQPITLRFSLPLPQTIQKRYALPSGMIPVKQVFLSGTINNWSRADQAYRMRQTAPTNWEITISLPPGRHEYKYVIHPGDGVTLPPKEENVIWCPDSSNPKTCDDGFQGLNSVIETPNLTREQRHFRFMVFALIAGLLVVSLLELILKLLLGTRISLRYKILLVFSIFLLISNGFLILSSHFQQIDAIRQQHVQQINTLHNVFMGSGVDFARMRTAPIRQKIDALLRRYFRNAVLLGTFQYFSNHAQNIHGLFLIDPEGELLTFRMSNTDRISTLSNYFKGDTNAYFQALAGRCREYHAIYRPRVGKREIFFFYTYHYRSRVDEIFNTSQPLSPFQVWFNFEYNHYCYPIFHKNRYLGYYNVWIEPRAFSQLLLDNLYSNLTLLGLLLLLYFLLVNQIGRYILLPLHSLMEGLAQVKQGNLGVEIKTNSKDEIGELGDAFNVMTLDLKQSRDKNEDYAHNLESRVAARTNELSEKNSELVRITERLEKANAQLKELDELKTRFFANISHELRTPLTLISTPLQGVLDGAYGNTPNHQADVFRTMYRNCSRLLKLINQLLDFSRIQAGGMRLRCRRVNVGQQLSHLISSVQSVGQSRSIAIVLEDHAPELKAVLDHDLFEKAVLNLISNAVKFSPDHSRITISLSRVGEQFTVSVADQGMGISPEDLPHIFERFRRTRDSDSQRLPGTGIGLSLTREIALLHGGDISVESTPGQGSLFTLVFPVEQPDQPIQDQEPDESSLEDHLEELRPVPEAPAADNATATPGSRTVLVVEDNSEMRALIRSILAPLYAIQECENGEQGLRQAQAAPPDIIISDVMMPEVDGYEFCRRLGASPQLRHIPVILLSANVGPEKRLQGLQQGAVDFLSKPFNRNELLAKIETILRLEEFRKQLQEKENLVTIGILFAGLAHEIRNPLFGIQANMKLIEKRLHLGQTTEDEVLQRAILFAWQDLQRLGQLMDRIRATIQEQPTAPQPVALLPLVESVLDSCRRMWEETIQVDIQVPPSAQITTFEDSLYTILSNLVRNALSFTQAGGTVTIAYREGVLSVQDTGPGMDKETLAHVFDPFFSKRETGEGMGLGLYLVRAFAEKMGWQVRAKSKPGQGSTFEVYTKGAQ